MTWAATGRLLMARADRRLFGANTAPKPVRVCSIDVDTARAFAREYLAESLPRRWVHVQAVAVAATGLAADLEAADQSLWITAAWVHDIGYSPALCRTGLHPLDGARFLRSGGADSRLCALVAHHTAARVEAGVRGFAEMDSEFPQEHSHVADLLWLADLTTDPHVVTSAAALATPEFLAAAARARGRIIPACVGQSTGGRSVGNPIIVLPADLGLDVRLSKSISRVPLDVAGPRAIRHGLYHLATDVRALFPH